MSCPTPPAPLSGPLATLMALTQGAVTTGRRLLPHACIRQSAQHTMRGCELRRHALCIHTLGLGMGGEENSVGLFFRVEGLLDAPLCRGKIHNLSLRDAYHTTHGASLILKD